MDGVVYDNFLKGEIERLGALIEPSPITKESVKTSFEENHEDNHVQSEIIGALQDYLDQLDGKMTEYKEVIMRAGELNNSADLSTANLHRIAVMSRNFNESTRQLYDHRSQLRQNAEKIASNVAHFDALDPVLRRLNHSMSPSVVRKDSFKKILDTIDSSLLFLEKHPDFHDAESYRIKFKRCLIRACTLIAQHFQGVIKRVATEIQEKLEKLKGNSSSSSSTRDALLYSKFEAVAIMAREPMVELMKRIDNPALIRYHNELISVTEECYEFYAQIRLKFMDSVTAEILENADTSKNKEQLVLYIQYCKSQFQQLCIQENRVFLEFFPGKQSRVRANEYLFQFCEPLYEQIRTRLLRETSIPVLCDSMAVFAQLYEFEEGSEEYNRRFKDVQFDKLFEPISHTIEARLIFRIQQYIDSNIIGYKPSFTPFDLLKDGVNYALISKIPVFQELLVKSYITDHQSNGVHESGHTDLKTYYPPLIVALALLSRVYEMVNSIVFDDLAHQIVHETLISLKRAYCHSLAISKSVPLDLLDTELVYMRNLILFKDQLQNFNIQYNYNETYLDFSGLELFFSFVKDKSQKVIKHESDSILSLAKDLVPKVVSNMVDARAELIKELRNSIKRFTEQVSSEILKNCANIISNSPSETGNELMSHMQNTLPIIRGHVEKYLGNGEVGNSLLEAIKQFLTESYVLYLEKLDGNLESGNCGHTSSLTFMSARDFEREIEEIFMTLDHVADINFSV